MSKRVPEYPDLFRRIDIEPEDQAILKDLDPDHVVPEDHPLGEVESEPEEEETYYVSSNGEYYNETAMKAKTRNALPDDAFGLPRLRMYPLNDEAHVKQAIRMFGHCKDPKDRKVLAKNIEAAIKKFNMTIKIGKNNPLHSYVDQSLTEASLPGLTIGGFETPMEKRTKEQIVKEHIRYNSAFYNNIFYGTMFGEALSEDREFEFVKYFYPDMRRMNFHTRLQCACGGLASNPLVSIVYEELGIRAPYGEPYTEPLGWLDETRKQELMEDDLFFSSMGGHYDPDLNWFKVDLSGDLDHTIYCLRLYSVMGEIFRNMSFRYGTTIAGQPHDCLLLDWFQRVSYHYDLYKEAAPDSQAQRREMQYLFDLFWTFTDNPYTDEARLANTIWMFREMVCTYDRVDRINEANTPGELITKEKCSGYLVHDLGMPDDIFLLPGSYEYPIIDRSSVLLAMDNIRSIPEDLRKEYSIHLNRRYAELGCTFSISVDHPYAPYADQNIVSKMTRMLLEAETEVDDEGTSTEGVEHDRTTQPWYKRFNTNDRLRQNILDNKELGPNTKKMPEPDYADVDTVY